MKTLTAQEFKELIKKDPSWCQTITESTTITDYCDLVASWITHLSPLLIFAGKNEDGWAANFFECKELKKAEGTFLGKVVFSRSGIEEIGKLEISKPGLNGGAADFVQCENLKAARGKFAGYVDFAQSGIKKTEGLEITAANDEGNAANFLRCENLKTATGTYPGFVSFSEARITTITSLTVQPNKEGCAANFGSCPELEVATGTYPGCVTFLKSGIKRIENLNVTAHDTDGWAADLSQCPNLEIATGTFHGFVSFEQNPKLRAIQDLNIGGDDTILGKFLKCPNLKTGPKYLLKKDYILDPELRNAILRKEATKRLRTQNDITL